MLRDQECPICGWPYAFPELSNKERYEKCMAIHAATVHKEKTEGQ